MGVLRLERVTKRFGDFVAVHEVSLETREDEFLVLLGPSGCGKTTLLRILAGLVAPSGGRVLLDDADITYASPKDRDVAMVFQSYALYPHMSVAKNIGFSLKLQKLPRSEIAERVQRAAEMLQLTELLDRKPKQLSGGQRQRVALGRAIVRRPRAFLMDEPLSNLDAKLRTATRAELIDLHARLGTTFVYVTHDQVEAMTMATKVVVMNHGVVEQIGTPEQVFDDPATTFVAGFIGSPPMNLLPATIAADGGTVRVVADGVRVPPWQGTSPTREVLVGVRPEYLRRTDAGGDGPRFEGVVQSIENLGSEEVVRLVVGDTTVCLRAERPAGFAVGEVAVLTCDPGRLCIFDATSQRRLIWEPSARTADDRSSPAFSNTTS